MVSWRTARTNWHLLIVDKFKKLLINAAVKRNFET